MASASKPPPKGYGVYNPAFDVTPANLIAGIVTEFGVVIKPVNTATIATAIVKRGARMIEKRPCVLLLQARFYVAADFHAVCQMRIPPDRAG